MWIAKPLGHPDAARIGRIDELKSNPPAAIAALDHINPPGWVAAVRVVIACEEISILIEREFLRVAQATRENFQVRAVGIAAQHSAHFSFFDHVRAVLHVKTAIAHAEIESAIRAEAESVQIMTEEPRANAVTGL